MSNSNIAPASKERVVRLILSLEQERDAAILLMLSSLPSLVDWHSTAQFAFFSATLFPDLATCDQLSVQEHRWQKYLELRPRLIEIENHLATDFISEEQFLVFRKASLLLSS